MKHILPNLPYSYDALEPYIDAKTMEIHYEKHHGTYVAKLNEALDKFPKLYEETLESLLSNLDGIPEEIRAMVQNHGGGHYNHSLFWEWMAPVGQTGTPGQKTMRAFIDNFGSYENFKDEFTRIALMQFGSGWAWMVEDEDGKLKIMASPNQDTPMSHGFTPVIGVDIWEHAYYLKYQNKRSDYVTAWWNIVNWKKIEEYFKE